MGGTERFMLKSEYFLLFSLTLVNKKTNTGGTFEVNRSIKFNSHPHLKLKKHWSDSWIALSVQAASVKYDSHTFGFVL